MNDFWSKKIQSTELLYFSRAEKFNEENKSLWFKLLKVKDGMRVLEVGCGGGNFTNMIKKHHPNCEVYGIDIDENHIKFAKKQANKLGLDVHYSAADVKNLPFKNEYFDLVFSHTVIEHIQFDHFISEQKRVLKNGGDIVIMRVDMAKHNDRPFMFLEEEVNKAYMKLVVPKRESVAKYLEEPDITMHRLNEYGFKQIDFKYERVIYYLPDAQKRKDVAVAQIERNYKTKLYNALFVLQMAENGDAVKGKLLSLLEQQYKERLKMLEEKKKIFDFQSSNMIIISAKK